MGESKYLTIGRRRYRRFIPWPGPVNDGTLRCIRCGQIDEVEWHDIELCRPTLPQEPDR